MWHASLPSDAWLWMLAYRVLLEVAEPPQHLWPGARGGGGDDNGGGGGDGDD
jgi:hypothetical protein